MVQPKPSSSLSLEKLVTKFADKSNEKPAPASDIVSETVTEEVRPDLTSSPSDSVNTSDREKPDIPSLSLNTPVSINSPKSPNSNSSSNPESTLLNANKKAQNAMNSAKVSARSRASSTQYLLKTQNELELELQMSRVVTGPHDKPWNNYGIGKADDIDQLINCERDYSPRTLMKIKESVDKQFDQVVQQKRGWAYYEKHQPDYAAFETDMKKVIMELMGPVVNINSQHGEEIDQVKYEQNKLDKRILDIEFVYKRVVKNASAQQDALTDLETRSKALRVTEERLKEQVKACEQIKDQLSEKFALLRDDRSLIVERLDHTDHEIQQYRKDMREMHDQTERGLLNKVMETNKMSLNNLTMNDELREDLNQLKQRVTNIFETDFRDTSVQVSKLHEIQIDMRKQLTDFDKAVVTRFEWQDRNKLYDHEINIISAAINEMKADTRQYREQIEAEFPLQTQQQIDNTLQSVLGNRKKYMKLLKNHQKTFYEEADESQSAEQSEKNQVGNPGKTGMKRKQTTLPINIDLDSNDMDSDNSMDRMAGMIEQLQENGKLSMGGPAGQVSQKELMNVLTAHDEKKFDQVREKYIKNMPIRRQARYVEQEGTDNFSPVKNSKLRMLRNKQVWSFNNLSVYKHMNVNSMRRLSCTMSQRSGLSVNITRDGKTGNKLKLQQKKPKPESQYKADVIQFDRIELTNLLNTLANSAKFKIAGKLKDLLEIQVKLFNIQLFKVKKTTIESAILDYESGAQTEMSSMQVQAIIQLLSLDTVYGPNGPVEQSDYLQKKLEIISYMIELENASSEANSSQDSRRRQANFGLKPPAIQTTDLATDRSSAHRSKTMVVPFKKKVITKESETSSLQDSSMDKTKKTLIDQMQDLRSVTSSESKTVSSQSTMRQRKSKLSTKQSQQASSIKKKATQPVTAKLPALSGSFSPKTGSLENQRRMLQEQEVISDDSFDIPSNTEDERASHLGSEQILEEDEACPPVEIELPSTDDILAKMKDQIDELSDTMKERTTELRELQKYVTKFEQTTMTILQTTFKSVYDKMAYDSAEVRDLIQQRMTIISGKLVKNNKNMSANKERAQMENLQTERNIKIQRRQIDNRIEEVLHEHSNLMAKYDFLVKGNDYFKKMARQVISITELNSCLLKSDEKDKENICLMGSKGPKTLKEQHMRLHHGKEQDSEACQTGHGTQGCSRPQTGVSRISQKSQVLSHKSHQTNNLQGKDQDESTPVVTVDKRCQTCSDDRGQLIHMFKIACLAYHPSKVQYHGNLHAKKFLIDKQDELVNQLVEILARSDHEQQVAKERMYKNPAIIGFTNKNEEGDDLQNIEEDTQVNSGGGFNQLASFDAQSKLMQQDAVILGSNAPESEYASAGPTHPLAVQTSMAKLPQKSNIRKQKGRQSPSIRFMSPHSLQTELREDEGSETLQQTLDHQQNGPSDKKTSQAVTLLQQAEQSKSTKGHVTMPATQTSFRFNASHELLQYNQEQIKRIVPQSIRSGEKIDEKLMQIQKLKEKALMIQLSREVNKPNQFVAKKQIQATALTPTNESQSCFDRAQQEYAARDAARMRQEKETQLLIDTREKFTKRFQFEKVTHKMLSETPSNTHLSGSQHNDLTRYDSKTIFRQAKPGQKEDHQPRTYADLAGNKTPSLPKLTRNMSALQRHNLTQTEVLSDQQNRSRTNDKRPISSAANFWKTARRSDGRNVVVMNRKKVRSGLDWNQQRQSTGTEQLNNMLGQHNQSLANFSSQ